MALGPSITRTGHRREAHRDQPGFAIEHQHTSRHRLRRSLSAGIVSSLLLSITATGCHDSRPAAQSQPSSQPAARPISQTARNGPLTVTTSVDRDRVAIGDPVVFKLDVMAEQGVRVAIPKIEGLLGDFKVTGSSDSQPDCEALHNCAEWRFELICAIPGNMSIPALQFSFEDPRPKADGSTEIYRDQLTTDPIAIAVEGHLADLKGPMKVPVPFDYRLLWWASGTLAAVALLAWTVRWIARKWPARTSESVKAPPIPAHVWALRELDGLTAENLIGRGMFQEYYYRVNGLVRQYIERRFGVNVGEQTSEEFIRSMRDALPLTEELRSGLNRFIAACDPVKYARQIPAEDEIEWVGRTARQFIEQTAESETSPASGASLEPVATKAEAPA